MTRPPVDYAPLYSKVRRVSKTDAVLKVGAVEYSTISQELVNLKVATKCGLPPNTQRWSDTSIYQWVMENVSQLETYIDFGKGTAKYFPKSKLRSLIRKYPNFTK
jgi:hypothetical protein